MFNKTVGEFHISTSGPYPVWCSLKHQDQEIRFSHSQLSDLRHCVDEMIRHAWKDLGESHQQEIQLK